MKITRTQLRKLIQEAVYNPVAAMSTAKEKIARKSAEASVLSGEEIDYLEKALTLTRSDDEETQEQGRQLLDAMGEFTSPSLRGKTLPPELEYASTKNPEKTGTIQNRVAPPGDITGDSELAMKEFIGSEKDIKNKEIINIIYNTKYKPLVDKLQLQDMDAFFSTPQWKESVRSFQDQYIDVVAGSDSFGIGFDTSGDVYPSEEFESQYDIMRGMYGDLAYDEELGISFFDILEDIERHFQFYGARFYNDVARSYSYDPEEYQISPGSAKYYFRDLVYLFKDLDRKIRDGFHNAIDELFDEGVLYSQGDDRFIVFDPDVYDNSKFKQMLEDD
jgi:hypothetical protein